MEVLRPASLDEAVQVVGSHPDATLLAGGTDVMVDINLNHARPDTIISLRGVPELAEATPTFIGSGVTYAQLLHSPHPGLAQAARTVGSPQIRARGTIGGNLGTASPAGDTLPFLVAAEAEVVLASTEGERRLAIDDFLVGPKENALSPGELIVGVALSEGLPGRQAFSKVGTRQAMVISVAGVCVLRDEDGATRVALGAVGPTVFRAPRSEQIASAGVVDDSLLERFQASVSSEAKPVTDHRATAEYRRHAIGVIARRALERVA